MKASLRFIASLAVALSFVLLSSAGSVFADAPADAPAKAPVKKLSRFQKLWNEIEYPGASYAGTETCALPACHGDTARTWKLLRHSREILNAKDWPEERRGCEGCHGPASEHFMDPNYGKIAKLSQHPEFVSALCSSCHPINIERAHFIAGVHLKEGVSCGTCHDVHREHGAPHLLRGSEARSLWTFNLSKRQEKFLSAIADDQSQAADGANPVAPAPEAATPAKPASKPQAPLNLPASGSRFSVSPADAVGLMPAHVEPPLPPATADSPAPRRDRGAMIGVAGNRMKTAEAGVTDLCLSCHPRQNGEFHQNSRHPVLEGRMTCASCHNPHDSRETMRLAHSVDDLCAKCHADKRGPFLFEHDMTATGEGCLTCHRAHGSPNQRLLRLNGRAICLQCHSDIATNPNHLLRPGNCWRSGCHVDIHGSQTNRLFHRTSDLSTTEEYAQGVSPFESQSTAQSLLPSHATNDSVDSAISALALLASEESAGSSSASDAAASADNSQPASADSSAKKKANAVTTSVTVVAGFQGLGASGNRNKLNQYAVKPDGAFFDLLGLSFDDDKTYGYGEMLWAGLDGSNQKLKLDWESPSSSKTRKYLRYSYDRAGFFLEPSQDPVNPSDRRDQSLRYVIDPGDKRLPEIVLNADQDKFYAPGIMRYAVGAQPGSLSYYSQTFSPEVRMPFGSGGVTLTYSHNDFGDKMHAQPDARTNLFQLGYDGDLGMKTALFGSLSDVSISQNNLGGIAHKRAAKLGLVSSPFSNLTATLEMSAEGNDQPNTLNAYVRTNNSLIARLRYRPERILILEGAYERQNMRRLNNPQNYIDAPRWDGGWLSLRLNPGERVSIFVRQRMRRLHDAPEASIPNLEDLDALLYDKEDDTDAYLTIILPANALFYANFNRNKRFNTARNVGSRNSEASAGITVPLSQALTANADWTHQNWDGDGSVLTVDPLRLNYGLPFVSDGDYWNLGFSYLPGRDSLSANLYRFLSTGGESVRGSGFTVNYEHPVKAGVTSRLQIGKDKYNDHVLPGFNYSDSFIRIDLARKF